MKFEFSAGGIVYKKSKEGIVILLSQHSQHHGWVFPKGLIGDKKENESKEETAIREVEEETGIEAVIEHPVTPIVYWYQMNEIKRKKTVYYFIMRFLAEHPELKDDEMEAVEWLPIDEVEMRLTYPSDKKVWQEAKVIIAK